MKFLTPFCTALIVLSTVLPAQAQFRLKAKKDADSAIRNSTYTNPDYRLQWKVDAPIIGAGTAWTLYAFGKIYDKDSSTIAEVNALDKNDLNGFDRWAAGKNSEEAARASDLFFYGSIPLPLILMAADSRIRKDFGKVSLLYWETMAITGTLYTGGDMLIDRYRPEAYANTPAADRVSGNFKNSFFAGHVANVGSITSFAAKIYHDYHPDSKWKWAFWGGSAIATGTTAYLRHRAGKHFPTDIVVGTIVGYASGILVPELHKKRKADGRGFSLAPYAGPGQGVSIAYHF